MCLCCRNVDPDDMFAYNTVKTVRIRDRYLGFLRFFLLFIIFIYIVVKVLLIDRSYLVHDVPIGFVRTSLMFPRTPVVIPDDQFCPQNPNHNQWPYPTELEYPCRVWDANNIVYPPDEVNSIFMATRITETKETYKCGQENTSEDFNKENTCDEPYVTDENGNLTYFLSGVGRYTLGIQHSFYSNINNNEILGNSKLYEGALVNAAGKVVKEFTDTASDIPDIITVDELLSAAGVDIAAPSRDPANSQYYSGIVVIVLVHYTNDPVIKYTYKPQAIPSADYKLYEVRWNGLNNNNRVTYKRAGPKLIFMVTGDMVKFDFQTMLIQLMSAMGLLSMATLAVEMVMLYILPMRQHYSRVKFEETEDFSHLRVNRRRHDDLGDLNAALVDIRETGDFNDNSRPIQNF